MTAIKDWKIHRLPSVGFKAVAALIFQRPLFYRPAYRFHLEVLDVSNHTESLTLLRQEQSGDDHNVWRLVSALWPYFSLYRRQLALIALCLSLEMAFNAALPLSLKILIDR